MKDTDLVRRRIILAGSALPIVGVMPRMAWAAPMVDSLSMFIPAGPGGGWDTTVRSVAQVMQDAGLIKNVQYENVGGAGGMVGLPRFVNQYRGKPNAMAIGGSVMVGAGISNNSPVTIKNVVPLARLTDDAGVLAVPTSSPYKTWADFAAALKANPKAISVAGGSAGGTDQLLLGLILQALGADPRSGAYVAFAGGGAAIASIIGGQVSAGISGYSEFSEQVKGGRMRALAVSGAKRINGVDVPTLRELGVDVVASNWRGLFAAPGIAPAARQTLIDMLTKMHATAAWKSLLDERKWVDAFLTGDAFGKEIDTDIKQTTTVMKALGLA